MGIFKKKTWTNRISEYPDRRTLTFDDGSTKVVKVARNEGTVAQEGEAFNEANMKDLENRIDTAFTDAMGNNKITYDGSNFYISNGTKTKKLGSSDGTATTYDVLDGVTFNSRNTKDTEDYSTGTMLNLQGQTVSAVEVTSDKTGVYATLPTRACYDTNSKVKLNQSAVGNVYDLGTGTSFDIKSKFPNDYGRLTSANFLVTNTASVSDGRRENGIESGSYIYYSANVSLSAKSNYNPSTGVFTCSCTGTLSGSCGRTNADYTDYGTTASGSNNISTTPHVYLILGKITTI